jgi:ABC-type antimicrobial peptide transport system permease subunit
LSYLGSYLLNNHSDLQMFGGFMDSIGDPDARISLITPWLAGMALLFSSAIGLISGFLPAHRATRLSALTAIRTE